MTRRSSRRRWSRRRRRWRSRTGPRGCWAGTSGSATRRSPGRGARYRVQPWRRETFKFSTDPELEAKVRDVVGPLSEPAGRTRSCSASTRSPRSRRSTAPSRSCRCGPGCPRRPPTTTSATAPPPCSPRWRSPPARSPTAATTGTARPSSSTSSRRVARAYPRRGCTSCCDNYHTHKHDDINRWLAKNPRITLHFTPTSGSWLNLVEVFFGIITRQAIRRGSFDSVKELVTAIRAFIDGWNDRCHPFIWTKTADEILPHATRQPTSDARH